MGLVSNEDIYTANKSWGIEFLLKFTPFYNIKMIQVNPNESTQKKCYENREETWVVTVGSGTVSLDADKIKVSSGSVVHIPATSFHSVTAGSTGLTILSVCSPEIWEQ